MPYEVIVVGAGIGGLTTAALLAARGVNVCLLERNESVGGCVANFEQLGYTFEPTAGLYAGWGPGEIFEQIFAEVPVTSPDVRRVSPAYAVRLSDQTQVVVSDDVERFAQNLSDAFPECTDAAISFYREVWAADESNPDLTGSVADHLAGSSPRFRSFIEAQLQIFSQCSAETCSYSNAATTLTLPRHGLYSIRGGAEGLARVLMESIEKSGGTIRLNAPVLRLAYASDGMPQGVDLLSGETVVATRAIVSNLTVWDTYGKLVGLNRTPAEISRQLKLLGGWGAYLMFLALDESANQRLPLDHILAVNDLGGENANPADGQFIFSVAPTWDPRAQAGKRAVTVWALANSDDWFAFHHDNTEHEQLDQATLENWWTRLHRALPELGDSVEAIETVTPRSFYETTRRKFGMVGSPHTPEGDVWRSCRTPFPNLFLVGDTVSFVGGLHGVALSARTLADALAG